MFKTPAFARARAIVAISAAVVAGCATTPSAGPMGFFVTSEGSGRGADLGGLAGADAHCQKLAAASGVAGAAAKTWRAYLSAPGAFPSPTNAAGVPSVNARDRIGAGPWFNAKGEMIAKDVAQLHSANRISKTSALDEKGAVIKGRGDTPNQHDILTGSREDGTAFAPQTDTTCKAWTSSSDGSAIVGHHDLSGPLPEAWARSWVFSHQSAGCSQEALVRTGGSGRFYCFASN